MAGVKEAEELYEKCCTPVLEKLECFVCLDCGIANIKYLWPHKNHNLRLMDGDE